MLSKAWLITCGDFEPAVMLAASAGRCRATCAASLVEVGYALNWREALLLLRVRRAPRHDCEPTPQLPADRPLTRSYFEDLQGAKS